MLKNLEQKQLEQAVNKLEDWYSTPKRLEKLIQELRSKSDGNDQRFHTFINSPENKKLKQELLEKAKISAQKEAEKLTVEQVMQDARFSFALAEYKQLVNEDNNSRRALHCYFVFNQKTAEFYTIRTEVEKLPSPPEILLDAQKSLVNKHYYGSGAVETEDESAQINEEEIESKARAATYSYIKGHAWRLYLNQEEKKSLQEYKQEWIEKNS